MLVLTRKTGQRILIRLGSTTVAVQVCRADRGTARLGIDAPDEVQVDREEVAADKARQVFSDTLARRHAENRKSRRA